MLLLFLIKSLFYKNNYFLCQDVIPQKDVLSFLPKAFLLKHFLQRNLAFFTHIGLTL